MPVFKTGAEITLRCASIFDVKCEESIGVR
jgi:hypothetical protein